jgi:hypothetical protein
MDVGEGREQDAEALTAEFRIMEVFKIVALYIPKVL